MKKSLSCIHGNIDKFFWLPHMRRLTSCVICKSLLDDIRGRMNGEWFYKGQSERKDKAKPCNLLLNALSLTSLSFLAHSACLSVFLPLFFVIFISSVFWGCVKASSVDLMPNLLLCLIVRLRISPPVIQFNYSKTRSTAMELRQSTS